MPSWNGLETLFWIVYDIYEIGQWIIELIITKYDCGEFIYKVFMHHSNKGHDHYKVPHLV
jgi:hypothetical protein